MKLKIKKSLSLLLAVALTFTTITDGTVAQAAKKSKKKCESCFRENNKHKQEASTAEGEMFQIKNKRKSEAK